MNNMEIKVSVKDIPEVIEQLEKAEKSINDLQQENKQLKEEIEEYERIEQKDIEAFNNYDSFIVELEEWLKSYLYMLNGITDKDVYEEQQLDDFADFMDKIQELKEKYK